MRGKNKELILRNQRNEMSKNIHYKLWYAFGRHHD